MIVNSFQIDESLQLTAFSAEKAPEACQSTDARIWLDLQAFEPNELEDWLDKLAVTALSKQLCLEARDRAGFYPLKSEILLVIPFLCANAEGKREVDYLALLCRENLLVTMHRASILSPQRQAEIQESRDWLTDRSIAALVSAMMIDLSMECLGSIAELRSSVLALEGRMDREPDTVEADEILDMRAELLTLDSVASDQLPSLKALSTTDKAFFNIKDARDYMNCALANLQATERSVDRLDQRVSDLRSGFQMHAQDKTNRRLGLLTILSAIFMPITLLAGIWGMNFETMPELKLPLAYPMALGLMVLIGSGMYFFFRRYGWFDMEA